MKTTSLHIAITLLIAVSIPSCIQEETKSATVKAESSISKPVLVQLTRSKTDQTEIKLRWTGDSPAMDMSETNSGDGWAVGTEQEKGIYSFAQDKFYSLTLNFNDHTFEENGFDGTWLEPVKGTWSAIK